jgi:hypothetical protein
LPGSDEGRHFSCASAAAFVQVDSLLHNPLFMPDLFALCADLFALCSDLMKGDIFLVFPLLPSFGLCFFLCLFLLQVSLLTLVPCAAFQGSLFTRI